MIRKIEEKDIEQCLNIYNFYIKESTATFECDTLNIDEFKERIKRITKNFPYLVYEYENKVLGYAYLDYFIDRKAAFMSADLSIYIDPNARSKALGTQLLEKIIEIAPTYGIKNIISVVTTDNLPSIKFHERNGFHKEGQINDIAFKFGKKLGVIYYKLVL